MTQSVYDTRVFYKRTPTGGFIIAHVHVDDTRLTSLSMDDLNAFYTLWADDLKEERKPLDVTTLDETFAGIRHHFIDRHTCVLSCTGTIDQLIPILSEFPLEPNLSSDSPIACDSLKRLFAQPTETNPLVTTHLHTARRIVGLTSFVSSVRNEVLFAFKVLARFVNERRLTSYAWREIRRMAAYLVATRDTGLILSRTGGALTAYVDSSLNNGPDGRSYGGFALQFSSSPDSRSGSFMVSCSLPTLACDSSGAAELFQSVRCTKAVLGFRIFLKELGFMQPESTLIYTDAKVLIDGTRCRKVSNESKWVSPRYAMIRYAETSNAIRLIKFPTEDNFADITTKPLTGAPFEKHRAAILGLPKPQPRAPYQAIAAASIGP